MARSIARSNSAGESAVSADSVASRDESPVSNEMYSASGPASNGQVTSA